MHPETNSNPFESLIGEIVEEYIERVQAGENPDVEEYAWRHPAAANMIRLVLGAVRMLNQHPSIRVEVGGEQTIDRPNDARPRDSQETPRRPAGAEKLLGDVWGSVALTGDAPPAAPLEVPSRIGRFRVLRPLGEGGFGMVFLAEDPKLQRQVALKVARPEYAFDSGQRDRFLREARLGAALNHPAIVSVYEVGTEGLVWYIAAEFCRGPDLAHWLRSQPQLPPARKAAELLREIALGVEHAHQGGVLHRDLKPANVLFAGDSAVKVSDFGLAKLLDASSEQSRSGTIAGTPSYMPPEQAAGRNRELGPTADVYSLGAILYELLTGLPPFRGESAVETLRLVAEVEPVSPRRSRPGAPVDLETICLKCLEKDPADRYPSAAALADDLDRFLQGRAIVARPLGPARLAWRWAKRNRAVAALGTLFLLSLVAGTAVSIWYALKASASEVRAIANGQRAAENERQAEEAAERARRDRSRAIVQRDRSDRMAYAQLLPASLRFWEDERMASAIDAIGRTKPSLRGWGYRYLAHLYGSLGQRVIGRDLGVLWGVVALKGGRRAATAGQDGFVRVWDIDSGKVVRRLGNGRRKFFTLALTPEGQVAAGDGQGKLHLWDPETGKSLPGREFPSGAVAGLAFTADGQWGAAASDTDVWLWPRPGGSAKKLHGAPATQSEGRRPGRVAFSPDGEQLAAGFEHGLVRVWDVATGEVARTFRASSQKLRILTYTPDGSKLLTGGEDFRLSVWDAATGQKIVHWPWGSPLSSLSCDTQGKNFITTTAEGKVIVADLQAFVTGDEAVAKHRFDRVNYLGHRGAAWDGRLLPDGKRAISVGQDGTVRVWDLQLRQADRQVRLRSTGRVAFSHDGSQVAVSGRGVTFYDSATGKVLREWAGWAKGLAYSPDGKSLAVGWNNGSVEIRPPDGEGKAVSLRANVWANRLAFSPDGTRLAVGSMDGSLSVFSVPDRKRLWKVKATHGGRTSGLAYAPDGRTVASAGKDGQIHLWRADTGEELQSWPAHEGQVYALAFSPNGKTIASGGEDRLILLWDAASGKRLRTMEGSASTVWCVRFGPKGERLFSGGEAESVRLWDVRHDELSFPLPRRGTTWAYDLDVSPDGNRVAAVEMFQNEGEPLGVRLRVFESSPDSPSS